MKQNHKLRATHIPSVGITVAWRTFVIWSVIIIVESVQGLLRATFLSPAVGDFRARQAGVLIGSLLILLVTWLFIRWIGAERTGQLLLVGISWLLLTIAFEVGLGYFVIGLSADRLIEDYDISRGGLLGFGLLVLVLGPFIVARLRGAGNGPIEEQSQAFRHLALVTHDFLARVPLHNLNRIHLPGGPSGLSMLEIKERLGFNTAELKVGPISQKLFWLRTAIGKIFGWDKPDQAIDDRLSYIGRLSADERARSQVSPGTREGISRVVYCNEDEFLAEIINKTVHCFWLMAIDAKPSGYDLYMAVYVRKLNWFTPIYMTLIAPVLRWIIYPSMAKAIWEHWHKERDIPSGRSFAAVNTQ